MVWSQLSITWAHQQTILAQLFIWKEKPVALSIVQARLVGLFHFAIGYVFTYAAFIIGSTSSEYL